MQSPSPLRRQWKGTSDQRVNSIFFARGRAFFTPSIAQQVTFSLMNALQILPSVLRRSGRIRLSLLFFTIRLYLLPKISIILAGLNIRASRACLTPCPVPCAAHGLRHPGRGGCGRRDRAGGSLQQAIHYCCRGVCFLCTLPSCWSSVLRQAMIL
jgi:hypothetical protein